MRIVITGATGAIGHALIELCMENNIEVLAICHRNSARIHTLPQSDCVKVMELDLEEYDDVEDQILLKYGKYDVFYHLAWSGTARAARNVMELQYKNIAYSLAAVKLAKRLGCSTFIGAGSQAEYGRVEGVLRADTPAFPENGYGIAKLCAGQMTRISCKQKGIKHIWTRILSVYGPYDGEDTMVISTIRKLLQGETPAFTKGEQQWDYLYSKDAARAMLLLGKDGVADCIYPIGCGKTEMLKTYIEIIKAAVDPTARIELGKIPYTDKQVMYLCADISALEKDTGFVPRITFDVGIRETVAWVKKTILEEDGENA